MTKTSEEMTNKIKLFVDGSKTMNFEINYIMESKDFYVCYGKSKGRGNNCDTIKIDKKLFE